MNAQDQFELSFPDIQQSSGFYVKSPENSTKFYIFGDKIQVYNTLNSSLNDLQALPTDIFYKANLTGYSTPYQHMNIHTFDEQNWWMVHEGQILHSIDGGTNWQEALSLSPNTQYLNSGYFTSIHFPSESVGYAVGTANKIFKTIDGGNNWQQLQWSSSTAPYRRLSNVYFIDDQIGFALGYEVDDILLNIGIYTPLYYYTTDGGNTWSETSFPESDHHYLDITFVNESVWYLSVVNRNFVVPNDKIYKSEDGGMSWQEVQLPGATTSSSVVLRSMHWFTPQEGILLASTEFLGKPNHIYKTFDGGLNWTEIILNQGIEPFFGNVSNIAMKFNGDTGLVTGASGNILISNNRGQTWQTVQKGYADIYDMSSDNGITYAALYGNTILKHNQNDWEEITPSTLTQEEEIGFEKITNKNENLVAVKDAVGGIHYSSDGGNNWTTILPQEEDRVLDIHFEQSQLQALVFNTTNSQLRFYPSVSVNESFEVIANNINTPSSTFDLFFTPTKIYARVENTLFKRENNNWTQITLNNYFIRSLLIDKEDNMLAQSTDFNYHYSNNGGNSWSPVTFSQEIINRVDFEYSSITGFGKLNETTHFAIINGTDNISNRFNTYLIQSTNNGTSWSLVDIANFSEPNFSGRLGYAVNHDGNLWIGTALGNIFIWSPDGNLSVEENQIQNFNLYPNPTQSKLYISLISSANQVQATIYSIEGKKLKTQIFNQNSFEISLNNMAPGVYLLVVNDGKSSSIKRFIKNN